MKLGSLFDGIGGFPLSGTKYGFEPVWASEIEPFPVKVTQKHFLNMKHLGDITQINGAEIEPVDVVTFGSPCTRLSVAGRHDGFDVVFTCEGNEYVSHELYKNTVRATDKYQYVYKDTCPICGKELVSTNESALFFHAIRIINEMREATNGIYPRFIVWENVPGAFSSNKGQDFRAVLEEIGNAEIPMPESGRWATAGMVRTETADIAWRTLDAQHHGVPQRRRRIFLVADFRGQCAGEILFVEQGLRGNPAESGEEGETTTASIKAGIRIPSENNGGKSLIYSFDSLASNSMKSGNPHSGGRFVEISKTIDTTIPDPSKNQGGIAILQQRGNSQESGEARQEAAGNVGKGVTESIGINGRQDPCCYGNKTGTLDTDPLTQCIAVRMREGCAGGGKGPLISEGKSLTLGCSNDQAVFTSRINSTPEGIAGAVSSKWAKGTGGPAGDECYNLVIKPRSQDGVCDKHRGVVPTLNTAQGGQRQPCVIAMSSKQQSLVTSDDVANTLGANDYKEPQIVAFTQNQRDEVRDLNDKAGALQAEPGMKQQTFVVQLNGDRDNPGVSVSDKAFCIPANPMSDRGQAVATVDCRNLYENDELSATIQAKPNGGQSLNYINPVRQGYAVRRLTPTEALRLQGFPDWWLDIEGASDTAKYKAIGNSVAIPCVDFVMSGIARVLGRMAIT